MKKCAICGKPLTGGVIVHQSCVPKWIAVEDRLPETHINSDGAIESSVVIFRCGFYKTVHLGRMEKIYIGKRGEMVHPVYRWFDQWGDLWEEVSHWMPLPEPPEEVRR